MNPEQVAILNRKIANLTKMVNDLIDKNKNLRKVNADLLRGRENSRKASLTAIAKEEFITKRVIQKYGRNAFCELMNTIEAPVGFNAEKWNKRTEMIKSETSNT